MNKKKKLKLLEEELVSWQQGIRYAYDRLEAQRYQKEMFKVQEKINRLKT